MKVGKGFGAELGNFESPSVIESSGETSESSSLVKNCSAIDMVRKGGGAADTWRGSAANAPVKALEKLPRNAKGIAHPGGRRLGLSNLVEVAVQGGIGKLTIDTHLGEDLPLILSRKPCIFAIPLDLDVVLCRGDDVVAIPELIWCFLQLLPGFEDVFRDIWLEPDEQEGFLKVQILGDLDYIVSVGT